MIFFYEDNKLRYCRLVLSILQRHQEIEYHPPIYEYRGGRAGLSRFDPSPIFSFLEIYLRAPGYR